jgi:hypothetical protein
VASLPLVYVHGAGPQAPVPAFKHEVDGILFGRDMPSTRVAYYADVRWSKTAAGRGAAAAAAGPANRAGRVRAIRASESPQVSPTDAASAIVDATLRAPRRGGRGAVAAPAAIAPEDLESARQLVERLYQDADRVASVSSVRRRGTALGPTFPDPIFRFVVGKFASDVVDYLYGPFKEAMREPVRRVLLQDPAPKVIVAHSLGTIILYDVLSEPALAGLAVNLLVTVGCPLGLGNVQDRLRDGAGRPNPVPPSLAAWMNFADRFDPVALEATLRDEFDPPKDFASDAAVNNPARNNHDLTGYLSVGLVHSTIVGATG